MPYFRLKPVTSSPATSFNVVPWTGQGGGWMVTQGVCFSTYSYDTGSFVPIKGINSQLQFRPQEKIYIDYTILPNLQISGAKIMCAKVGYDAGDVGQNGDTSSLPAYWYNYPSMVYINPQDITDDKGRVIQVKNGKRQIKGYALIAYRGDDTNKNGSSETDSPITGGQSYPVQILNSDIIMMTSMVSGVPVVVPLPYLNGLSHLQAVQSS